MQHLFDIQGNKIVIHPDAYGLPPFRKLWESEDDKSLVTDYISYIVWKNKYNSPYRKSYSEKDIEPALKQKIFGDSNYKLSQLVLDCEEEYLRLTNTLFIRLLKNSRKRLDSISDYYESALNEELDDDRVKVILTSIEKLGNTAKSIEMLEDSARKEESKLTSKIRGGGDINAFEIYEK